MTHGTTAQYRRGCRCEPCRSANTRYDQYRRLDLIRGIERTVDSIGTRRRVQALHCMGWTLATIAKEAGWGSEQAIHAATKRARIQRTTADRIAAVYERLAEKEGPSDASRGRAQRKGYQPPWAWLDIDDPNERPDPGYRERTKAQHAQRDDVDPVVVQRLLAGDWSLLEYASRAERVELVNAWPGTLGELQRLTGLKPERYRKDGAA